MRPLLHEDRVSSVFTSHTSRAGDWAPVDTHIGLWGQDSVNIAARVASDQPYLDHARWCLYSGTLYFDVIVVEDLAELCVTPKRYTIFGYTFSCAYAYTSSVQHKITIHLQDGRVSCIRHNFMRFEFFGLHFFICHFAHETCMSTNLLSVTHFKRLFYVLTSQTRMSHSPTYHIAIQTNLSNFPSYTSVCCKLQ